MTETKKTNQSSNPKKTTKKQVLMVAMMVIVAFGAWQYASMNAGFRSDKAVWVRIPANATIEQAKDSIISSLGDDFGGKVARLWNENISSSHGAYLIEPKQKAWRVAKNIGQGRQTPVKITFNNVRTFNRLAEILSSKMDFSKEDFLNDAARIAQADTLTPEQFAVQFLPDTYEAYWTATTDNLIAKIRSNYARFWTPERKTKAARLGITPMQASILASIVEEESNRRDERPTIARLYLNRLHKGMPLQADPTVKFAWGDPSVRRITGEMLKIDSPYNTYKITGLPPGIIRLPEAATIDAVLNAPQHNYIYMCARPDGSGRHDFTTDYSTHLRNAANYRKKTFSTQKPQK